MICQLCGGQVQATASVSYYYNVTDKGVVFKSNDPGPYLDVVRIYCVNDCQSEPGAVVVSRDEEASIVSSIENKLGYAK